MNATRSHLKSPDGAAAGRVRCIASLEPPNAWVAHTMRAGNRYEPDAPASEFRRGQSTHSLARRARRGGAVRNPTVKRTDSAGGASPIGVVGPLEASIETVAAIALERQVHGYDDHQRGDEENRDQVGILAVGDEQARDNTHNGYEGHRPKDRKPIPLLVWHEISIAWSASLGIMHSLAGAHTRRGVRSRTRPSHPELRQPGPDIRHLPAPTTAARPS